jgi:hypothetical protein
MHADKTRNQRDQERAVHDRAFEAGLAGKIRARVQRGLHPRQIHKFLTSPTFIGPKSCGTANLK